MIQTAQLTEMPLAGMYEEKVYEGPHENDIWTWVKFEDEFYHFFAEYPSLKERSE